MGLTSNPLLDFEHLTKIKISQVTVKLFSFLSVDLNMTDNLSSSSIFLKAWSTHSNLLFLLFYKMKQLSKISHAV